MSFRPPAWRWAVLFLSILVPCLSSPRLAVTSPPDLATLLRKADSLRMVDYLEFTRILQTLVRRHRSLSALQADQLRYLEAWKDAYEGRETKALGELKSLAADARDRTLRFRAEVTATHLLALSRRYADAFSLLADALARLPGINDGEAREQGLVDAAEVYEDVGAYDLSLSYAQTVIEENWAGRGRCDGGTQRLRTLKDTGQLPDEAEVVAVIQACRKTGEAMHASEARMVLAELARGQQRYGDAIRVLAGHYDEAERLYNPRLLSAYNALLAEVYHRSGQASLAHELARRVTVSSTDPFSAALAGAYQVLYQLAREQGDFRSALAFHEKYATVDKAYLDEVGARTLAFQRARHETLARRLQVATLHKQNDLLQLEKQLSEESAKSSRLQVTLLTVVLTFVATIAALIGAWAYRTKRLQLHFMTLSRIDALTGIYNRPYFIEQAESLLEHSRRAGLEVSVLLWDADNFKAVNDRFGHATGDSVLRRLVQACKAQLRRTDILGRFGGEEFVVVLPGCSAAEAAERADIMRTCMSRVLVQEGRPDGGTVSASFGVTCTGVSGYELARLLAHADAALYTAKRAGRNCVVVYDGPPGTDPEPGGIAWDPVPAAHVRGVKAREAPASRRRWMRPRDGQARPYRGRVPS
jgi:diguanylate cyclase (GGDEF)-like protein